MRFIIILLSIHTKEFPFSIKFKHLFNSVQFCSIRFNHVSIVNNIHLSVSSTFNSFFFFFYIHFKYRSKESSLNCYLLFEVAHLTVISIQFMCKAILNSLSFIGFFRFFFFIYFIENCFQFQWGDLLDPNPLITEHKIDSKIVDNRIY